MKFLLLIAILLASWIGQVLCFQSTKVYRHTNRLNHPKPPQNQFHFSSSVGLPRFRRTNMKPLQDILGLGVPEIALIIVAGLVLFGPETLKSLSKDVGRAAAELKEIPKTFKEGMEEGQQQAQISKLKEIAAEKRKKRLEMEVSTGEKVQDNKEE